MKVTDRYAAFISYVRSDLVTAQKLQKELERFRIPRQLVNTQGRHGLVPASVGRIFLDTTDLSAAPEITEEIERALKNSATLIVVCSLDAARPASWVNREIAAYRQLRPAGRIYAVLVRDDPPACFPPELLKGMSAIGQSTEPLAADLRPDGQISREVLTKLIAGIVGVEFDELLRRRVEAETRRRRFVIAIVAAYAATVTGALLWVTTSSLRLRDSRRVSIAQQAKASNDSGRHDQALLLSAIALVPERTWLEKSSAAAEAQAIRALLNNQLMRVFDSGGAQMMVVDPAGSRAYVSSFDGPVRALHLPDGSQIKEWHSSGIKAQAMAMSDDGREIAIGTKEGTAVVLETASGKEIARTASIGASVRSVALAPSKNLIAMGDENGYARTFDLNLNDFVSKSPQHRFFVSALAFSPDSSTVLSGSYGTTLMKWSAVSGQLLEPYLNNDTISRIVSLSSNGRWAVAFVGANYVLLKSPTPGVPDQAIALPSAAHDVSTSESGRYLLSASQEGRAAYLNDISTRRLISTLKHPEWVYTAQFVENEKSIVTLARDGIARVWKNPVPALPRPVHRFAALGPTKLAWRHGSNAFVALSFEGEVVLVDLTRNGAIFSINLCEHRSSARPCQGSGLSVSDHGETAIAGTKDGLLALLDLNRGAVIWSQQADQAILATAIEHDGKHVVVRLSNGTMERRNIKDGTIALRYVVEKPKCEECQSSEIGMDLDPSGANVAETSDRLTIRRLADGDAIWQSKRFDFYGTTASWAPNSNIIAVGTAGSKVLIFPNVPDAQPVPARVLQGHTSWVYAATFSPDSKYLLTTSDKEQILWHVESGEEVMRIDNPGIPTAAVFSDDESRIITSDSSGIVRVLPISLPAGDLRKVVCENMPTGRTRLSQEEMIEFPFIQAEERSPCDMPRLFSWDWMRRILSGSKS